MNCLTPFFLNFCRGMRLLTAAEQKRFPLMTKIVDDKEALEGTEVANEEDDIAIALPSAEADKSEYVIEEHPKKRRKLQRVTTLELIDQRAELRVRRSVPTKLRSMNVRARSKIKARRPRIEEEDSISVVKPNPSAG